MAKSTLGGELGASDCCSAIQLNLASYKDNFAEWTTSRTALVLFTNRIATEDRVRFYVAGYSCVQRDPAATANEHPAYHFDQYVSRHSRAS